MPEGGLSWGQPEAVTGKCTSACDFQPVFLAMLFLLEFFTILAVVPATTATLRLVRICGQM